MGNKLKNFFRWLALLSDRDALKVAPRPLFDWWLLTIITIVIFAVLFAVYLLMIQQVNQLESKVGGEAATSTAAFNQQTILNLAAEIEKRRGEFELMLPDPPRLKDPANP